MAERLRNARACVPVAQTDHSAKDNAVEIAEYWRDKPIVAVKAAAQGGLGFDAFWSNGLRTSIREILSRAASGRAATPNLDSVGGALSCKDIRTHLNIVDRIPAAPGMRGRVGPVPRRETAALAA